MHSGAGTQEVRKEMWGGVKGRIGGEGMVVMFYANILCMHEFLNKTAKRVVCRGPVIKHTG